MTIKTTGITNTRELYALKQAACDEIAKFISKHTTLNGQSFMAQIEKEIKGGCCPLEAESWQHQNHGGWRITAFFGTFNPDFLAKLKAADIQYRGWPIDWDKEQITVGIQTY